MEILNRTDTDIFKRQALQWAALFNVSVCLSSNNFTDKYSRFETLIAVEARHEIKCQAGQGFEQLAAFRKKHNGWVFGYFGYDLKNEVEDVSSNNPDNLNFPDLYFFVPKHILLITATGIELISDDKQGVLQAITQQVVTQPPTLKNIAVKARFTKAQYIETVKAIQQHIIRGDIYETNFCQEFYADNTIIDPISLYTQLTGLSPSPFGCFFKLYNNYIISASPERFLAKRGNQLISQPIKGTAKRGTNPTEDEALKLTLQNPKEQQENVMIVDLVRNDLTRSARAGTVKVEELFGIYSFEQVHQMISTVRCEKADHISDVEAIKNTFPMGSMTGAPKINAITLMEKYERTKRGVYSGAVGYFSPNGEFDFNVVIRTMLYNAKNKYLSFQVGGAITHNANPEHEYNECLLKAKAILQVLGAPVPD